MVMRLIQSARKVPRSGCEGGEETLSEFSRSRKVEADAMDAQVEASTQRRGGADISATAVVSPACADDDEAKEKAVGENQIVLKLSSVLSRIKVGKRGLNFTDKR